MTQSAETAPTETPRAAPAAAALLLAAARLAALCALPILAACGGTSDDDRWRVVERLSSPPDAEMFSLADVSEQVVVRPWLMSESSQAALWTVQPPAARGSVDRRGLWLSVADPGDDWPQLTAEVALDAQEISVIELRLRDPSREASELLWAGAGEEFRDSRRLFSEESARDHDRGPLRVIRFPVARHPEWRGAIRKLRLRPAIDSKRPFAVVSLRAIRAQLSTDLVEAAVSRGWKVDLEETIRDARMTFPGQPWRTTVRVPDGESELRFVPGLPTPRNGNVELSVRAAEADGSERPIFSAVYSGRDEFDPGWQEPVRVALAEFAGRELELIFSMTAAAGGQAAEGFAAWGNARVEARDRGPSPPNVVLICIDTLRADRLSAYGNDRVTSPNIDRWAADSGVLFENVVAPAPWTLPSLISIFTGLDAIRHGANYHLPARPGLEMLAETLAHEGYQTVAWTGGGYLGPAHGLHQGFESLSYHLGPPDLELAANTERVIDWLDRSHERPFFLLFHTYEVHAPYFPRQPYYDHLAAGSGLRPIPRDFVAPQRRPTRAEEGFMVSQELMMSGNRGETWEEIPPELRAGVVDRYDSGIAYTDAQVGRVLGAIEQQGLARDTVVILTSDHGEQLGEHDLSGHSYLYDVNLLVPLIVAAPSVGWPAGKTIRQQVRSVDIVPTVRDLLGLEPAGELDGESLAPLVRDRQPAAPRAAWSYAANSNRGVSLRLPGIKYVYNNTALRPIFAHQRLFDLTRDPAELENLAEQRPDEAARLRRQVRRRLAEDVSGLWFRLRSGPQPMSVELAGAGIAEPIRLKAIELPGDGARPLDGSERVVRVDLPAESQALLFSDILTGEAVRLRVAAAPGLAAQRWRVAVRDLATRPWSARVADGSWIERPTRSGEPGPWLTVFTTGSIETSPDPTRTNQEIRQQLRALGYLQ